MTERRPACRTAAPALAARLVLACCAAGVAAAVLLVGASSASDPPPAAPVETLHRTLIEIMRTASGSATGGAAASRERSLAPVVRQVFDLGRLARVALGPYWNALDSRQRARMVTVVSRYTTASYAARFDSYSGERFETTGTRPLRRGRVLVRTLLHPPDGESVRLDYVVQPAQDGWRIANVVAEGVSELALRRAEYEAVMAAEGFEALIGRLEHQIAALMTDSR